MKPIYLFKIVQHGTTCYIGKIDPRELVRIATKVEMGDVQDAQRPLSEKRVKDIAKYVNDEGILPNTLTIATKDNRFIVKEKGNGIFFIEFPSEEEEFKNYFESIDVMDGQHRLYSFLSNIRTIEDNIKFEIGFTLYINPTLTERRSIFVSCNEKQEKVSGNLLMWFREKLNMLTENERNFYNLVHKLNSNYPLKNRIIMSAEKIPRGFKADQVMDALKLAHIQDLSIVSNKLSEDQKVKVICTYLTAWEKVCSFTFTNSTAKQAGAAVKMAGFRFMLLLLQPIWDRSINLQKKFNSEFCEDCIKHYISNCGIEYEMFFLDDKTKLWFRDRTAISYYAGEATTFIKQMGSEDFNPLA